MSWSSRMRVLLLLLASALAAAPILLVHEAWWIRHLATDMPFGWWNELAPHIQRNAGRVVKRVAVAIAALWLLQRLVGRGDAAERDLARLLRPLRWGGGAALVCLLPFPVLDAPARLVLPATLVALFAGAVRWCMDSARAWPIPPLSPRRARNLVGAISLLLFLVTWWRVAVPILDQHRDYLLTGDQPAYLYVADSIVKDGDLDVSNNTLTNGIYHGRGGHHAGGVKRHNFDLRAGTPEFAAREAAFGDAWYPTHRIGVSLLIAPLYAIGEWLGDYHRALVCLLLIAAMAAALRDIAASAMLLGVAPWSALGFGIAAALTVPVASLSTAIFPEIFVFLMMARLMRHALEHRCDARANLELAAWLALAPWLQDKYVAWALPFVLARLALLWRTPRALIVPAIPVMVSAALAIHWHLLLYGQWLPKNALGKFVPLLEALPRGIGGMWWDWGFGLAALVPACVLAPAGLRLAWTSHRDAALAALATVLVATGVIGTWWYWWGGFAPPSRFLLTLLPVLFPWMMAAATTPGARPVGLALWCGSIALGLDAWAHPELWYGGTMPADAAVRFTGWDVALARFHPFVTGVTWNGAGLFVALAGATAAAGLLLMARRPGEPPPHRRFAPACAGLVMALLALANLPAHRTPVPPLGPGDVPTRSGILRDAHIAIGEDGTREIRARYVYRHFHGPLAMGVHLLDREGHMIGQADFDMNDYRKEWRPADDSERAAMARNEITIRRPIDPPPAATAIRLSPYNPALAETHRSQRHTGLPIIALP